jgi:imidazolonepropionase-like amidohydrolase
MHTEENKGQTLIKGGLLIKGTGEPAIDKGAILIEEGRIVSVGKAEEIMKSASPVQVVDCSDQTLLPGLIDCHNHLSLDPRLENYLHRMADPIPALTIRAFETMQIDLLSGVTTSRCLGDKGFLDVECRKAVAAGRIEGPRLLIATRGIRVSHGHGFVGYPFDGVDQMRVAVRQNLKAGADLIKFYATGTLKGKGDIKSFISKEEMDVIVEEAHRVGVPAAVHCIGGIGLRWCIEAGVDSIEHGYFISDEEIDLLAKSKSWLVLTPSIFLTDARIQTLPPELIDGHYQQREMAAECMAAAIKGGVRFGVGTDGMHGGLAKEMEYLVKMGASENDAIMAATSAAAHICCLEKEIGILEPGKLADIIGVEGNPLKDITSMGKIRTVILNGKTKYTHSNNINVS